MEGLKRLVSEIADLEGTAERVSTTFTWYRTGSAVQAYREDRCIRMAGRTSTDVFEPHQAD